MDIVQLVGNMTKPALIELEHINVEWDNFKVLDNINLIVEPKDFVTIVGPNGAGKSTLLKCILGVVKPKSGKLSKAADLKINYVPQRMTIPASLPLRVSDFLMLNKNIRTNIADWYLEMTSIEPLINKQIKNLSGGEFQQVLIARALIDEPQLLILDEPAQNLDLQSQTRFYDSIDKIYENVPIAILMVSHDLHLVMSKTKRVICLFHHICCSGKPGDVIENPEFVSLFGEDFSNMMRSYHHLHDHKH